MCGYRRKPLRSNTSPRAQIAEILRSKPEDDIVILKEPEDDIVIFRVLFYIDFKDTFSYILTAQSDVLRGVS